MSANGVTSEESSQPISLAQLRWIAPSASTVNIEFDYSVHNINPDFYWTGARLEIGTWDSVNSEFADPFHKQEEFGTSAGTFNGSFSRNFDLGAGQGFQIMVAGADGGSTYLSNLDISLSTGAAAVPEPSTFLLFGAGLAGVAFLRRKRKV